MTRIKNFKPISSEKFVEIIGCAKRDGFDTSIIASRVKAVLSESGEYSDLIAEYRASEDKATFLIDNEKIIAFFLNKVGLIGYPNEISDYLKNEEELRKKGEEKIFDNTHSFVIGAEAISLISAYLKTKPRNVGAHPVQVIANKDLVVPINHSMKHVDIFLENNQIHHALFRQLKSDLEGRDGEEINKTYIIETFGTTGGNHVLCLTIRKNAGEKEPIVHLIDPSPAVARNGLEATENSIANGWCSQLIINATVKKVFEDVGLEFSNRRFFNNSEPLQESGFSLCATFACEMAYNAANLSRAEHEELLESRYRYLSPYGGRTEIDTRLDKMSVGGGYLATEKAGAELGLTKRDLALSHFVDTSILSRAEILNVKADGEESLLERVARHQAPDGRNQTITQKALRQKLGHLFEIVTSDKFRSQETEASASAGAMDSAIYSYSGSPYSPPSLSDADHEAGELVKALNNILPRNKVKVNQSSYDGEVCKIKFFLGYETTRKFFDFMCKQEEGELISISRIEFGHNLVGIDERLSHIQQVEMTVPKEKIEKMTRLFTSYKEENTGGIQGFAADHPFSLSASTKTQSKINPLGGEGVRLSRDVCEHEV